MDPTRRRISIILLIGLAIYFGRAAWHSAAEIVEVNDFEVFHNIGDVAAHHRTDIYDVVSPVKKRGPFLYPPSAAILFVPLSWLPHDMAGYLFSALKMACLVLLLWGAVHFSGTPPRDLLGVFIAAAVTCALLFRPIDSDIGNGQINIIVAAAAVAGVWLMMTRTRVWWLGSLLLAWAIAMKLTPLLLLAAPLLHRKYSAFSTSIALVITLMIILPGFWFGWSNFNALLEQHRDASSRFTLSFPAADSQGTATELLQFSLAHHAGSPYLVVGRAGDTIVDSSGWPAVPLNDKAMAIVRNAWLALGAITGAAYLLGRRRLRSVRIGDWTWDLAMLCALVVFLSPRAQKAHLVILIVPVSWIICRMLRLFVARGFLNSIRAHWPLMISVFLLGFFLLIAENLRIPLGELTTISARPGLLLAAILMIGIIVRLGRADALLDENAPGEAGAGESRLDGAAISPS